MATLPGPKKPHSGQFKKGVSGNPGGRHKENPYLVAKCKSFCDEIIDIWIAIARNEREKASDRIKAGDMIYERAWGRPKQTVDVDTGKVRTIDTGKLTPEQVEAITALAVQTMDTPEETSPEDEA